MNLFIGCSANNNIPKEYFSDCQNYLDELLVDNDLVSGGGSNGLMGLSYEIAKKNGKRVIAISPEIHRMYLAGLNFDEVELTASIPDRTNSVFEISDAIIFLPGGIGTVYELFTAIELKRNGKLDKPIILYNSNHYFDGLLNFIEAMYEQNFASKEFRNNFYVSYSAKDSLNFLKSLSKKGYDIK